MKSNHRRRMSAIAAWAQCALVALGCAAAPAFGAAGSDAQRTGREIVDANCAACHAKGAHGAPRIGDKQAWSTLASRGLTGLTDSAIKGVRQMPPHGGNPGLSNSEIERAIIYMVNRSGGEWVEPVDAAKPLGERSGEQIVREQCSKCHETGKGGAPKIGDRAAWIPRLNHGLDATVRSAINGHGGMPPRGGKANLTDRELRSAVIYMFNPASAQAGKK
ncbi:MAG TPA: c-type cytochrome [Burkholderiales bacterium]